MRGMRKGRRYGEVAPGSRAPGETPGTEGVGGTDQGYVAYLLERLLYGTSAHGNMELDEFRAMVRKEYRGRPMTFHGAKIEWDEEEV